MTSGRPGAQLQLPWPLSPQIWVAFFCGPLAVTVLAHLNSRRLDGSRRVCLTVLAIGAAALLATLALDLLVEAFLEPGATSVVSCVARCASRAIALIAYPILERVQRSADRIYRFRGGEYDPAWINLVAIISGLAGLQYILTRSILSLVIPG